jgi:hypothetical protein
VQTGSRPFEVRLAAKPVMRHRHDKERVAKKTIIGA